MSEPSETSSKRERVCVSARPGAEPVSRAHEARRLYAFEGWLLSPEGAAIHRLERTAVIADVHLGYEWARGGAGDCVPAHSLQETVERLARVLDHGPIARLIVAGDLVESARPCLRTEEDVRRLRAWLSSRGVKLTVLAGNHDRRRLGSESRGPKRSFAILGGRGSVRAATSIGLPPDSDTRNRARPLGETEFLPEFQIVGGWTIGHGDRPIPGPRTISGHHHPALHIEGTSAPCFLLARGRIILPAFSRNAAGIDLLTAGLPGGWQRAGFQCVASTGEDLLDFGPLVDLRRLRARGCAAGRRSR